MAKKVDFQQVLLQQGERIGIIVAGALTLLLIIYCLFLPGRGLFAGSSEEKAKTLDSVAQWVNQRLNDPNNVPGDSDKPAADSDKKIEDLVGADKPPVDPSTIRLATIIPGSQGGDLGRRQPKVFNVEETRVAVDLVPVRSYIFGTGNPPQVYGLVVDSTESRGADRMRLGGMMGGGRRGGPGGPGAGGGMPGLPGMGGGGEGDGLLGMPGMVGSVEAKKDKKMVPIALNDFERRTDVVPAVQTRPLRLATIVGSFPYKKQVEEFRARLGLRSVNEVLSEVSSETGPDREQMPAFRFLGVKVQRREVDGDGKPVTEFKELDLKRDFAPWLVLTGKYFEDDKPEYSPLIVPGLVMPRLRQFRENDEAGGFGGGMVGPGGPGFPGVAGPGAAGPGAGGPGSGIPAPGRGRGEGDAGTGTGGEGMVPGAIKEKEYYTNVEKDLDLLAKTIKSLEGKKPNEVATTSSRFNISERFDIFSPRNDPNQGFMPGGAGEGDAGTGVRGPMPGDPRGMRGPRGPRFPGAAGGRGELGTGGPAGPVGPGEMMQPTELPEHCLVRLIDVTVQPGKTYEYRLAVRMGNPNIDRRDVASPTYADAKELVSEWSKDPIRVHVPPELNYYLVDQKDVDLAKDPKVRYDGPYARANINKDKQVVMQAHRWVQTVKMRSGNPLFVGEWAVAERFPVFRGEYVGRTERIEVPVWRTTLEEFVIASDSTTSKRSPGIDVDFGYGGPTNQPEAILVDFENGRRGIERVLSRTEEKVDTRKVVDQYAGEALLLMPDGRLVLRDAAADANDKKRQERLEEVKKRIHNVKHKVKAGTGQPFGGGTGPGGSGT